MKNITTKEFMDTIDTIDEEIRKAEVKAESFLKETMIPAVSHAVHAVGHAVYEALFSAVRLVSSSAAAHLIDIILCMWLLSKIGVKTETIESTAIELLQFVQSLF